MKVSESYIIGIDILDGEDQSVLTVARHNGSKLTMVNMFTGEEAEWMYNRLTNSDVSTVNRNVIDAFKRVSGRHSPSAVMYEGQFKFGRP